MEETYIGPGSPRLPRYYEDLGRAHDYLMRCKDCQALVPFAVITKLGCCHKCGTRRFIEITILSEEEMAQIESGEISFPDSDKFLKEFKAVDPNEAVTIAPLAQGDNGKEA